MQAATAARGSAHGKAILIGEHAVVYGAPAIAMPLPDLTLSVTIQHADETTIEATPFTGPLDRSPAHLAPTVEAIRLGIATTGWSGGVHVVIDSRIPDRRGLGSSAATAAAVLDAFASLDGGWDAETQHERIQLVETVAHGTPSGLDARTVVSETPLWFEQRTAAALPLGADLHLVIGDTGASGETRAMVARVRHARDRDRARVDGHLDALALLASTARDSLGAGDLEQLGMTLASAHDHLASLDVSTQELDALVAAAMAAGSPGAKLTGGGGGGCVLAAAVDMQHAASIRERMLGAGATACWTTTVEAR